MKNQDRASVKKGSAQIAAASQFPTTLFWIALAAALIQLISNLSLPILGDDAWFHLNWLDQFSAMRHAGVAYPRWLDQSYGGLGSPTFYFYPPLPYFLGSFFSSLLPSLSLSGMYQLLAFLAAILSGVTCYYYLRSIQSERMAALTGALLYMVLPYRFVDAYVRSALGEHFSFVFLPLLLMGIEELRTEKLTDRTILRSIVFTSLGWAGTLLVNVPATVIFAVIYLIYVVSRIWPSIKHMYPALCGAMLGALMASIYILPISEMRKYTQMNHIFDIGSQEAKWSFALREIFTSEITIGRVLNVIVLLAGVIAFVLLLRAHQQIKGTPHSSGTLFRTWIIAIGVAIFFQVPYVSNVFWNLPLIDLVKYSWRWNIVLTLGISVFISFFVRSAKMWSSIAFVAVLAIFSLWGNFKFAKENAEHPSTDVIKEYYNDAPEYLPIGAPKKYADVVRLSRMHRDEPKIMLEPSAAGTATLTSGTPDHLTYQAALAQPATITLHHFQWPMWKLREGQVVVPTTADSLGRIQAKLSPGTHVLDLTLDLTPAQQIGRWMSVSAAILFLICLIYILVIGRSRNRPQTDSKPAVATS